ncbi:hypothetical protein TanjilG_10222 [Lupinus angustifolius]|uniref:Bifunctional inhibitor/plant lipid transfer protein/seed storage helical domain-containing protein n=1 Tax=Lupinus angustifolius TaxID=3871 RepID=A0A4P1RBQ8_LUPAN|nr:hypothetical protein TanjilG_10222 [Lupinus angustifolius]
MMKKVYVVCGMVLVLLLLMELSFKVDAVNCIPEELSPCFQAITRNLPPPSICCQKIREQIPCLCGYLKDPNLKQYISSPGARRISTSCGVPNPTCSPPLINY